MANCIYNLNVALELRYFLGFVNLIQGLAAAIGNLLVFVVVFKNRRLNTRSNAFLLSLAASDLLVGFIVETMHVVQFFSQDAQNNCSLNMVRRYLSTVFMGAAIGSIALISYDRWIHLKRTVCYKDFMTKKKVVLLISICWFIPIVVPFVRFTSEVVYSTIILIYVTAAICLVATCYIIIIKIVKAKETAFRSNVEASISMRREAKNHIKAAKAISIVITFILVTFVPISLFHGFTAINGFSEGAISMAADTTETAYAVLMTIALANSGINPIIYYLRMPEFNMTFKRIFACFRKEGTNSSDYRITETSH